MKRRSCALSLAAMLLLTPLTGCVTPTDLFQDAPSSTSSTTPSDTLTGAGRSLDEQSLTVALPAPEDLDPAWHSDNVGEQTREGTVDTFKPQRCGRVASTGPEWDEIDSSERAEAEAAFERTPDAGSTSADSLALSITSYDEPYPSRLMDLKAEALTDCRNFKVRAENGEWLPYELHNLAFPTLGDSTVALRMSIRAQVSSGELVITMDVVTVKVGHNVISTTQISMGGIPDTSVSETAIRTTLAGLEGQP